MSMMHIKSARRPIAVGIDVHPTTMRMAIIDANFDHFPWPDDLMSFRTLRALAGYWETRFPCSEEEIVVAINSLREPDLLTWLLARGSAIFCRTGTLQPFLLEGADYDISRRFRTAHALANYAYHKARCNMVFIEARSKLSHLTQCLRDVEGIISRLAAVAQTDPSLLEHPTLGSAARPAIGVPGADCSSHAFTVSRATLP